MVHTAHQPPITSAFEDLIRQLESLHLFIEQQVERDHTRVLDLIPGRQASAKNLLHYLALRSRDLRPLQDQLAHLGLSSIGRSEPHVLATLDAVLHNLRVLSGKEQPAACLPDALNAFHEGAAQPVSSKTPSPCWASSQEIGACTSWSPCLPKPRKISCWCGNCLRAVWIVCALTAPMMILQPGPG